MKKESYHEELINKEIADKEQRLESEKLQVKRISGVRLVEIALVVVVVVLGVNLFLGTRNIKASEVTGAPGPSGENQSDLYTQYPEEAAETNTSKDPLAQLGLEYYLDNYGEGVEPADIRAVAENFGCHMEIHIYKSDERVMRLSYFNGQVYEI